jgi:hypothetical protein
MNYKLSILALSFLVGCVTRVEPPAAALDCGAAGGSGPVPTDVVHEPPPVPDANTLCDLILHKSTEDQVKAVLGAPNDEWGSHAGGGQISYDFASNANITFGFNSYVFDQAMLLNVPYPQCWADEDRALIAPNK